MSIYTAETAAQTAIAWCLAWGGDRVPQFDLEILWQTRWALGRTGDVPQKVKVV
jgi:CRISPR-associated protein Cmr2